ncbi:Hypothetical Protein CGB_C4246C [Cryptococcus gattii WM276]|uniref:Integrase catalytic domain-containing protein n=1 Tax=Cryptococcus gattii serotype B (strain WM276 / ATCC MYA-4071) TaxID=367775 RepID=E6R3E1_CRYGW|nr:Hypothetical Protein CGB_C4246C [Cryptococcus gattii WM276]ADV21042.1 Hypothetical Protein CGB_C4246C [Cryptococcus gattii WM276]
MKSEFFCDKVKFLGHVISANHICPDPVKVRTIREWPKPQSPWELRSFLGLLQYLQKFIPAIAQHTCPLTALLPPNVAAEKAWIAHQCVLSQAPIYLFTDASKYSTGTWLGQGPTPEDAYPMAYDSCGLSPAKQNYPTHEKELLTIIDHIAGVNNFIADALSRLGGADPEDDGIEIQEVSMAVLRLLGQDVGLLKRVAQGYSTDEVMGHWLKEDDLVPGVQKEELTVGNQVETILRWEGHLCVPNTTKLHEAFILKPAGHLHSLPVPQAKFLDISIEFIGPLPVSHGYDQLIVITDWLTGYVVLIPTNTTMNSSELACLLYDHWLSKFSCPRSIISDQGSVFQSTLWKHLMHHIGAKSQLSTAYHPQTDKISEHSNKSIIESLHTITDICGRMWADNIQHVAFAQQSFLKFLVPTEEEWQAAAWRMELEEGEARDNLLMVKHRQVVQANRHQQADPQFKVGDKC